MRDIQKLIVHINNRIYTQGNYIINTKIWEELYGYLEECRDFISSRKHHIESIENRIKKLEAEKNKHLPSFENDSRWLEGMQTNLIAGHYELTLVFNDKTYEAVSIGKGTPIKTVSERLSQLSKLEYIPKPQGELQ